MVYCSSATISTAVLNTLEITTEYLVPLNGIIFPSVGKDYQITYELYDNPICPSGIGNCPTVQQQFSTFITIKAP